MRIDLQITYLSIEDELSNAEVDQDLMSLGALNAKAELELFELVRSVVELSREREFD